MSVPSASIAPTLEPGDRILTNKFVCDFAKPDRGDLVVFESVDERKDEEIVKRVVGLPGEEISAHNGPTERLEALGKEKPRRSRWGFSFLLLP